MGGILLSLDPPLRPAGSFQEDTTASMQKNQHLNKTWDQAQSTCTEATDGRAFAQNIKRFSLLTTGSAPPHKDLIHGRVCWPLKPLGPSGRVDQSLFLRENSFKQRETW